MRLPSGLSPGHRSRAARSFTITTSGRPRDVARVEVAALAQRDAERAEEPRASRSARRPSAPGRAAAPPGRAPRTTSRSRWRSGRVLMAAAVCTPGVAARRSVTCAKNRACAAPSAYAGPESGTWAESDAFGPEAGVHRREPPEAAQQQAGRHQQQGRQAHLHHHQPRSRSARARPDPPIPAPRRLGALRADRPSRAAWSAGRPPKMSALASAST